MYFGGWRVWCLLLRHHKVIERLPVVLIENAELLQPNYTEGEVAQTVVQSVEDGDFSEAAKKRIENMSRIGQANEKYAMDVAKEMEQRFRDGTLNHALLGQHSCMPDSRDKDYMGKILVMNYEALKPEYRSRPYQLWLATGGFGCSPTARGRRVFATSLYDGEQSSFYRQDFTGIIKPEVWEEVQSQYDFQITTQEVHKDSETPQEGMEP